MNDKLLDIILMVGLVVILVMAVLPLFNINEPFAAWLCSGCAGWGCSPAEAHELLIAVALPWHMGSGARGLSSCSSWALEPRLSSYGVPA